uniref:Uncharacterized protein n=1 Tax=Mus spicilegus TaxID=10103 RepID=A0A8C6G6G1_MUSSI
MELLFLFIVCHDCHFCLQTSFYFGNALRYHGLLALHHQVILFLLNFSLLLRKAPEKESKPFEKVITWRYLNSLQTLWFVY